MSKDLKKVLYLEDDPYISEIAIMALEEFSDLTVLHCDHGQDAIARFEDYQPDLLLFDVMLPDIDGIRTLEEIRSRFGAKTPVIFMTAKAQVQEQQQYFDLGAISVIVKPFDAVQLGDQLKSLWAARVCGRSDSIGTT